MTVICRRAWVSSPGGGMLYAPVISVSRIQARSVRKA